MLTVLIKHRVTGRDVLYPATCVEFMSPAKGVEGAGLLVVNAENRSCEISQHIGPSNSDDDLRDVFVMNENGATVARYVL